MPRTLLDSGPLVALLNKSDTFHSWAVAAFSFLPGRGLWLTDPVLVESVYLLRKYGGDYQQLLELVKTGRLEIAFPLREKIADMQKLMRKYAPRMDLADASLVVAAQDFWSDVQVMTLDRKDFEIYRLFGRQRIPLIAPKP